MLKLGKKGQLPYIVAFVIILIAAVLIFSKESAIRINADIGLKQDNIIKAYAEADAIREYEKMSARFATLENLQGRCPPLDEEDFKANFQNSMLDYQRVYSSQNNFNITLPSYLYRLSFLGNAVTVEGLPRGEVKISSELYGFDYAAAGYFKEVVDCATLT